MKKRIVSLFMALLMLLPFCLTGCGEKDDDTAISDITDAASNSARTLVMYVMTEDETLAEDEEAVSNAISALTESKYKTRLVVKYVTADKYYETIEAQLALMEYHSGEGDLWYDIDDEDETEDEEEKEEETVVDEYGITTTKYPETASYQIDLFYFGGYDKYEEYINNGWLASLNTQLAGTGLLITDYVSPMLLEGVKYKGQTYAIPNNNPIGEYTYLIINREIADKYYYSSNVSDFADVSSLTVKRFLDDLMNDGSYNDFVPFDASFDECIKLLANYWYIDPTTNENLDKFSLIGNKVTDISLLGRGDTFVEFLNLAGDEGFRSSLSTLAYYNMKGYFGDAKGNNFGLSIVKGDSSVLNQYDPEQYYSVILRYPEAVSEDLYGNMFGICNETQTLSRAMEILTYINTNAEVRNLLQYGIKNVNYVLDENGVVKRLNHNYMMNVEQTGNMFLAYPDPDAGYAADAWEVAKKQNQEALLNARLGFTFAENMPADLPMDTAKIKIVNGYSDSVLKSLKACTTQEEIDALIANITTTYSAADININYMIDTTTKLKSNAKQVSPYYVYFTWAKTYKYLTEEMQAKIDAQKKADSESKE